MVEILQRDIKCSQHVGRMAELGKFAKEFEVFGYAYRQNDETYYRIGRQEEIISKLCEKEKIKKFFPTIVSKHSQRTCVPSGMENDIWQEEQWELGVQLAEKYRDDFLDCINRFGMYESISNAANLVEKWKDYLEGRFERELQKIFDSLLDEAYLSKQLTDSDYIKFKDWSEYNWKQMEDDILITDNYERTLYGVLYEMDGKLSMEIDAQYEVVYRKRHQLQISRVLVTPIYHRTYWFHNFNDFHDIKNSYRSTLFKLMMPAIEFMRQLKQMPSPIPYEEFCEQYEKLKKYGTKEEIETMTSYAVQWNCCYR